MKLQKVLVTGSKGYIGSELCKNLDLLEFKVKEIDNNYFDENKLDFDESNKNVKRDIRNLKLEDFQGIDTVVHLAALSNDPLGEFDPSLTYEINRDAAINAAKLSKKAGVQRFIFVSTQSIYGISNDKFLLKESAPKNPVTAYAIAKWQAEEEILSLNSNDFCSVAIRPATVFGWGSRIRNDIIFNNLLMSGLRKNCIDVHTDGSPKRPVLYILDLVDCIIELIQADQNKIGGEAFNIGLWEGNFSVEEIAKIAAECLGGIPINFRTEDIKDSRTYSVDVSKLDLAINFRAKTGLKYGGEEIINNFKKLTDEQRTIYFEQTTRLDSIKKLISSNKIDSKLSWK